MNLEQNWGRHSKCVGFQLAWEQLELEHQIHSERHSKNFVMVLAQKSCPLLDSKAYWMERMW